ncbi:MAG: hypothetical protein ABI395_07235 [Sphingobium sp.]
MADDVHVAPDDARAGSTPRIVRYVLGFSLSLAILVMAAVLIWGGDTFT